MSRHLVQHDSIELNDGNTVNIKYWGESTRICVAAFDAQDNRVSAAVYAAEVEIADGFYPAFKKSVIESLATTIKNDLLNNPDIHYQP